MLASPYGSPGLSSGRVFTNVPRQQSTGQGSSSARQLQEGDQSHGPFPEGPSEGPELLRWGGIPPRAAPPQGTTDAIVSSLPILFLDGPQEGTLGPS